MKSQGKRLLISGPIWLFEMWLLAIFKSKFDLFLPEDYHKANEQRTTG